MKKVLAVSLMIFVLAGVSIVSAQDDIAGCPACSLCGMDRAKFAFSRIFIE